MVEQAIFSTPRTQALPRQLTSLLGRECELSEIVAQLADPLCCLLTLTGPGGIGKTRLAIQAAQRILELHSSPTSAGRAEPQPRLADGLGFVNLQPLTAAEGLPATIAEALSLPLAGHDPPAVQLIRHLASKELLLVLDNMEQLLPAGADFLAQLLAEAPGVKLLVTSRERLNLREEWVYPVQGLPYPQAPGDPPWTAEALAAEFARSAAVQLFVERARRVRRDFAWEAESAGVFAICRLVEGAPLALELAATWTHTLRCEAIAQEIQRNLDFLSTTLRNVPERHRSIQAVFQHSWQLLSPTEQTVFRRLSVFHGRFTRAAAEEVAGATLPILSALVDKSLVRWEADGWYQIHELLRQYGAEQLAQSPTEAAEVGERHCLYYTTRFAGLESALLGPRRRSVLAELAADFENFRQAWQWAVANGDNAAIARVAYVLQDYYDARGRAGETILALRQTVDALEPNADAEPVAHTLALVLNLLGLTCLRSGQLVDARTALERSHTLYRALGLFPPHFAADPLLGLGMLANTEGRYLEARTIGERARQQAIARNDETNLAAACYVLANATFALGDYATATTYAEQAHLLVQKLENHYFQAYTLGDLGRLALAAGDPQRARPYFQQSYELRAEQNDLEGMAVALQHLGATALLAGEIRQATDFFEQSLALYRQIDDQGGLARALHGLGQTALAQADPESARRWLYEALTTASTMQFWPLCLAVLASVAEWWLQQGQSERAMPLFALVAAHPASERAAQQKATALLSTLKHPGPETVDPAALPAVVAETLATTAVPTSAMTTSVTRAVDATRPHGQPLVEPLTERELEVLGCLAEGLSNAEIADRLIIAIGTVKSYTGNIYGKLGVRSRTQAVARARALGVL